MKRGTKFSILVVLVVVLALSVIVCTQPAPITTAPTTPTPTTTTPKPTTPTPTTTTPKPTTVPPTTTAPTPTAPAQVFKWKFASISTPAPAGDWPEQENYVNRIKAASGGRLDITLLPGGSVVPSNQILQATQEGLVEMGFVVGTYYTGLFPEANVVLATFPGVIRTLDDISDLLYTYKIDDLERKIFKTQNVQLLGIRGTGGFMLWAKKPIKTVADFKGMKLRSYGIFNDLYNGLGASTTFIPHEESYMALALGTVDAYATSVVIYRDMKHYEITPYIMLPSAMPFQLGSDWCANMNAWNSLPDDLKALLLDQTQMQTFIGAWTGGSTVTFYKIMADARAKGYNVETVQMDQEVIDKTAEIGVQLMDKYAGMSALNAEYVNLLKTMMKDKGYIQ